MNFVIVFVVVYCNLLLQSECAPLKENIMNIKFPRPVVHASSVTISGTLNVKATMLRATIKGNDDKGKEECHIEIKPKENIIFIGSSDTRYEFNTEDKEVIPFTLMITASSSSNENVNLHFEFNGNEAGVLALESPCKFKSFSSVDRIFLEGFKHIRRLTFEYEEEDDDDYA